MLTPLRDWMAKSVLPWMIQPYARGARNGWCILSAVSSFTKLSKAEEARSMLQGIGSRFDFHVCKTLCDIR